MDGDFVDDLFAIVLLLAQPKVVIIERVWMRWPNDAVSGENDLIVVDVRECVKRFDEGKGVQPFGHIFGVAFRQDDFTRTQVRVPMNF